MKKPSDRLVNYCEICKFPHYPVELYRQWLLEHGDLYREFRTGKRKMTKQSEQILRWREIVERHGVHRG